MRNDRMKAEALRKKGTSYKQISKKLGIPLATLSGWFKDLTWSVEIKKRLGEAASFSSPEKLKLMIAGTKKRWAQWRKECQDEALVEFPRLKNDPLFISGIMLYWGEGDKGKGSQVRVSNSDPELSRLFYSFLKTSLKVPEEKINASLILYPDLIDSVQKNFWSKATGISLSQFKKSTYIKGRHPTRRLSYGVCIVYVTGRKLKEKILKWIELYQSHFRSAYSEVA